MNVNNANLALNVNQGVQKHVELKEKINNSIRKLNENPNEIDTKALRELISQLVETNRTLEAQKQGLKETWWNKHGLKVSVTIIVVTALSGVLLTISSFLTSNYFDNINSTPSTSSTGTTPAPDPRRTAKAGLGLTIVGVAIFVFGITATIFKEIKEKKEENIRRNLDSIQMVQQFGELYLDKMVKTLEEFKSRPVEERNEEHIKKCLRAIDKMPKNSGLERIKKENLIPHMIEDLPQDNPLFVNYAGLRESAADVFEEVSIGETATAALSLPTLGGLKAKPLGLHHRFNHPQNQKWNFIEGILGVKLSKIKIGRNYLHKNGVIEHLSYVEAVPLETAVPVDNIEGQFDGTELELVKK